MKDCADKVIQETLDAVFRVHKALGPGLLESVYEKALLFELSEAGLCAQTQVPINVSYRGYDLGMGFRADVVVEDSLLLELKCVDVLNDVHVAQTITYLKLLGFKRGFLINFNTRMVRDGIRRISV